MIEQKQHANVSAMAIAWTAANIGDLDAAFRWIDRAIEERDTLVGFLHIYSEFMAPALTADPRYEALLSRLNLSDVAQ